VNSNLKVMHPSRTQAPTGKLTLEVSLLLCELFLSVENLNLPFQTPLLPRSCIRPFLSRRFCQQSLEVTVTFTIIAAEKNNFTKNTILKK